MSIEKDAARDLPLDDLEAGKITGGTKSAKTRKSAAKAKTHSVQYVYTAGATGGAAPAFDPATAPAGDNEDCGEPTI